MAGRPSPIDAIIGTRTVDGQEVPITVADRIVAALRAGNFLEHAIAASGQSKQTVYDWFKQAGLARIRTQGNPDAPGLTDHERRCMRFLDAVEEAEGIWAVDSNTTHERLGRGGIPQEVETLEYDDAGAVTKRTVRKSVTLPDAKVIEWRLKHRFPHLYAERLELSGPGGGPIKLSQEERASALLVLVEQFREEQPKRRQRNRSAVGSGVPEVEGSPE